MNNGVFILEIVIFLFSWQWDTIGEIIYLENNIVIYRCRETTQILRKSGLLKHFLIGF